MASITRSARASTRRSSERFEAGLETQLVDADSAGAQEARRDSPVGAVVALAAHDDHAPAVAAAQHRERLTGDGASGPLDQHRFGSAGCDRPLIGGGHLRGREHGFHGCGFDAPVVISSGGRGFQWSARRTTGSVSSSIRPMRPSTSSRMTGSISVTWSAMAW